VIDWIKADEYGMDNVWAAWQAICGGGSSIPKATFLHEKAQYLPKQRSMLMIFCQRVILI